MEKHQQLLDGLKQLLAEESQIINRLENIEYKLSSIERKLGENNQLLRMLMHKCDELDAKSDCLLQTTATRDSITNLHNKCDLLKHTLFQ
ncbi:hypothetical protein [Pelosinus sp. sgz500959]|uniref:hypothetical protein n=1 Tax=Pelosinus sp. sgz500959 TaxID=3242472 RepID=UPI00366F9A99